MGVTTRKCQNCPVRENPNGQFKAFSVNLRRLGGWKTPRRAIWSWFQGEKRALYCLISIAKQSSSLHCHLRHLRGTLKIVFQLKLLSARASPQLRQPDNLRTFVSSPHYRLMYGRSKGANSTSGTTGRLMC